MERVIVREGETYLTGPPGVTKYRFISKEYFDPTPTFIYGNKIAIVIFGEPLYGVIIESEMLSKTYRKQFNLLWKGAKTNSS